jgi:hypothetical protein
VRWRFHPQILRRGQRRDFTPHLHQLLDAVLPGPDLQALLLAAGHLLLGSTDPTVDDFETFVEPHGSPRVSP